MCDTCGGAGVQTTELDDLAQTLYGVLAAIDGYMRRSTTSDDDLSWAVQQLSQAQQRLSRASQDG